MGSVGILNVGAGDTKLVFDPDNPQDCIRAARIVADMLRRGYALLVDTGRKGKDGKPIFKRAKAFDEKTYEYIIADFDGAAAEKADSDEQAAKTRDGAPAKQSAPTRREKRIPASGVSAVAVARTAGG